MSFRMVAVFFLTLQPVLLSLAEEVRSQQDVDPPEAMQSIGRATWYNRSEDTYAPPSVRPEPDNPLRKEGWQAKNKKSASSSPPAGTGKGGNARGWFGWGGLSSD